ncbi:MAG TPA: methyltransferase domain-containing protein, partial [Pyrinomonadaceae bacterium]|nr:methyltransferase domain-containing protein [Pyrinomonadaceae bacterium]
QQPIKALREQQQQYVAEVRQEHRTELIAIQEAQARHLRQAQKLIQGQRLVQEQQSLLESSTADMRNRLDTLESSAYARIAQSESSTQALIAQLESSSRTWIAQFESSVRAEIAGIETSFQNEIASVATSTANLQTRITEAQPLAGDLQERIGTLESAANDLRFTTHKIESHANSMQTEIEKLYQQLQHARTELALQGKRLSLIVEEARRRLPAPFDQQQLEIIATEEQHKLDALYAELEDNFRGSHDEIKERFRTYLPHINSLVTINGLPIVDLGCGRGEWLELLQEEGYSAVGVDTNRVLLDRCRARGLDVVETDILDYLRGQPDRSLAAVTGFHIIEHLEIGILMRLLDEIARVLSPGGVVIFETPNPENVLVGSNYFYFDPTHRNPLPSLLMKFLLESRGLHRVEVMNLHAWNQARLEGKNELTERFNDLFYGPMDYAIAGWKVSA